ncbi:MAG: CapA family protein [Spirochaetota bacterium]
MLRLVLAGDVMLARGIDQIERSSVDPELREPAVRDARDYVRLAERSCGTIPRDVAPEYVWGDALETIREFRPHAIVLNLENAFTTSNGFDPAKRIHYRSHPDNANILSTLESQTGAPVICALANNHVLDLGRAGLQETLATLERAGLAHTGAGADGQEAETAAVVGRAPRKTAQERDEPGAQGSSSTAGEPGAAGSTSTQGDHAGAHAGVAVIACCTSDAGIPPDWAAGAQPGVFLLHDLGEGSVQRLGELARPHREAGRAVVVSIHWGGNWGYDVGMEQRTFAERLAASGVADVVHGHSSHHPRPFALHRGVPIFYGCGDLMNDYEGIGGHERFRPDLAALWLVTLDDDTGLSELRIVPFRRDRFALRRADAEANAWLADELGRENRRVGGPSNRGPGDDEGVALEATPDGVFIR